MCRFSIMAVMCLLQASTICAQESPLSRPLSASVNQAIVFADARRGSTPQEVIQHSIDNTKGPAIIVITAAVGGKPGDYSGVTLNDSTILLLDLRGPSAFVAGRSASDSTLTSHAIRNESGNTPDPFCGIYCAGDFPSVQKAINAAGAKGAVFIPGSVSQNDNAWTNPSNIPVLDFRHNRLNVGDQFNPRMAYLGATTTNPFNVTKTFSPAGNPGSVFVSAIRADTNALSGGTFNNSQQSGYASLWTNTKMVTTGQSLGWFHYNQGLGDGNIMGQNLVQECWGGTGVTQAQCTGVGEEDIWEGSSQAGKSNFSGTVTGNPGLGATTVTYTSPTNVSALGQRPLFNQQHQTTDGAVSALSSTAQPNDTFTFSGSPVWDPAAAACDNTPALSHCNPIGEFLKLGSTNDFYTPPCNGDDVVIDNVCLGHWYRVIGIPSPSALQLETSYDNVNLTHTFPGATYDLIQGAELVGVNATNSVILPQNSYQWKDGDTIYSPPYHLHSLLGVYLQMGRRFKSAGTAAVDSAIFWGSNGGTQPMHYGAALFGSYAGGFNTGLFINRGSNGGEYGIDISSNTWGLAGLNMGLANAIQWGTKQMFVDNAGIGLKDSASPPAPAVFTVYNTYTSASNNEALAVDCETTFCGLKLSSAGTGQALPEYLWNYSGGTINFRVGAIEAWGIDTNGNLLQNTTGVHINGGTPSNDISGQISISKATSASHTFTKPYLNAPTCVLTPISNPGGLQWWVTTVSTSVTANISAPGTLTFTYHCMGAPN